MDSTPLAVCHNARIHNHKVFGGLVASSSTSTGWFLGFKLHLVFDDRDELLNAMLSPGNVDDRKSGPKLVKQLFSKIFANKGYISQHLFEYLYRTFYSQLITKVKSNVKNRLMLLQDHLMLRKRAIVETIIDKLKNMSQIEHSRHRSVFNFLVNVLFDRLLPQSS